MEHFYPEKSRLQSASQTFSQSQSTLYSSAQPTPGHLRALPGYALPSTSTPAIVTSPQPQPVLTSTRYVTRERLYYERPTGSDSSFEVSHVNKPQSVVSRLADEAPPAVSLHEVGTLTPDRKHALTPLGEVRDDSNGNAPKVSLLSNQPAAQPSEGNWVTVFGFAGGQSSLVLSYFKKLGVVEEHEIGQGNWIHLKYSTLWAAQKALAKNGIIMASGIMIGVIPTDRAIEQVSLAADSFMSPIKKEAIRKSVDDGEVHDIFIRPGLFSPQANRPTGTKGRPSSEGATLPSGIATTASEGESLVTKALGYIFGW